MTWLRRFWTRFTPDPIPPRPIGPPRHTLLGRLRKIKERSTKSPRLGPIDVARVEDCAERLEKLAKKVRDKERALKVATGLGGETDLAISLQIIASRLRGKQ